MQRKRVEDPVAEAAPRATRTSSRLKATATTPSDAAGKTQKAGGKAQDEGADVSPQSLCHSCSRNIGVNTRPNHRHCQAEPAAKKTKKAPAKASAAKGGKAKAQSGSRYVPCSHSVQMRYRP